MEQQGEQATPTTRVKRHIITTVVNGRTRHRVRGVLLRKGQGPEALTDAERIRVDRLAKRLDLDTTRLADWWLYEPSPEDDPIPDHLLENGHIRVVTGDRGGAEFRARSFDDPIRFYERRGWITAKQARAARKLHQLWYHGSLVSCYVLMRYGEVSGSSDSDAKAMLYPEYRKAVAAIRGLPEQKVAYEVCCLGEMARGNMQALRNALDDLVRHFKF